VSGSKVVVTRINRLCDSKSWKNQKIPAQFARHS
jgi:hypothetical protein